MANNKAVLLKRFEELKKEAGAGTGTGHDIIIDTV